MRQIKEIIVHCAYTKPSMDIGADWIRKVHLKRGFSDIGYHYIIKRNGDIDHGRPVQKIGAHCKGHNRYSIGICLVGGMSEDNKPEDNFTEAQTTMLRRVESDLRLQFIDIEKTTGHSAYSNKPCPCFNVTEKLKNHETKDSEKDKTNNS